MALKALLLKRQIDEKKARMTELTAQGEELKAREAELETALGEAQNEEELRAVQELVEAFTADQEAHRDAVSALQGELDALEAELRTLEEKKPAPPPKITPPDAAERKDDEIMSRQMTRAFGGMTAEQRTALVQREDVQAFLTRFRELFGKDQRRSVTGAELTIPTVILEVLRQNIEDYSKLTRYVRYISIRGDGRQTIMGAIPEAVWTEMCAALNELNFTMSNVEVDGYKVGGYVAVCNALPEDSDLNLLSELITCIGGQGQGHPLRHRREDASGHCHPAGPDGQAQQLPRQLPGVGGSAPVQRHHHPRRQHHRTDAVPAVCHRSRSRQGPVLPGRQVLGDERGHLHQDPS